MQRRQRDRLAPARPQFQRAPERRHRSIRSALGEGAADLQLRIQPFAEAPVELEQEAVAVLHRGRVVLLPVEARLAVGQPGPCAGAEGSGHATAACTRAHRLEQRSRGARVEERIHEEGLGPIAALEGRDHALRGGRLLAQLDRERQDVVLRLALAELHLHDGDAHRIERNDVEEPGLRDLAALGREPAPSLEEGGQDHLDGGPLRLGEDAFPRRGHLQRGRLVLRLAHAQVRGRRLLEAKPVEGVLGEREQVRQFADGGKAGAAHQLGGNAAFEAAQVELDILGEARQVRDHQHALVLVLPDEGQYLGILRLEEFNGAPPEGMEALAQGDEPLHPPEQ